MTEISRVAVVGDGAFGRRLAAQFANAGLPCVLYGTSRGADLSAYLDGMRPRPLYTAEHAAYITFSTDPADLRACDWVIEAVTEAAAAKEASLSLIAAHASPGTIVSTATSTLSVEGLSRQFPDSFRARFLGTHFFAPPRYTRTVELVAASATAEETVNAVTHVIRERMQKEVFCAGDTCGFTATPVLLFALQTTLHAAQALRLPLETLDVLTGPALGRASSGVFGTIDLIGHATYRRMTEELALAEPEAADVFALPDWFGAADGAFYRRIDDAPHAFDPATGTYVPVKLPRLRCLRAARKAPTPRARFEAIFSADESAASFAKDLFDKTAAYAETRVERGLGTPEDVDLLLQLGCGWELGVFEALDLLEPRPVPRVVPPASGLRLSAVRHARGVVCEDETCALVDLGDGILCVQFQSPLHRLHVSTFGLLQKAADLVSAGRFAGVVIGNQGDLFSVGADIRNVLARIGENNFDLLDAEVKLFQRANLSLKYCPGPVVSAPYGIAYGGAIEMSQHADDVVIGVETQGGLVEANAGFLPSGGGTKEMVRRSLAKAERLGLPAAEVLSDAFETILYAKVSRSGPDLVRLGYLESTQPYCHDRARHVEIAKELCLARIRRGYYPPAPTMFAAPDASVRAALRNWLKVLAVRDGLSEHDRLMGEKLIHVFCCGDRAPGTPVGEWDMMDLERAVLIDLCRTEKTAQRIRHMLTTGRALRN